MIALAHSSAEPILALFIGLAVLVTALKGRMSVTIGGRAQPPPYQSTEAARFDP